MDNVKTNKPNKQITTEHKVETTKRQNSTWQVIVSLPSYCPAGLKVIDVAVRLIIAATVFVKLNQELLNYCAAFLAVTAIFEIAVALFKAYAPKK